MSSAFVVVHAMLTLTFGVRFSTRVVMLPSSDGNPIQVGRTSVLASAPAFIPSPADSQSVQLSTLALATVTSVLPVLIIFLFSQRFLVTGMTAGAIKE